MRSLTPSLRKISLFLALAAALPLAAADWPQYRGGNADGISAEKGLLKTWPAAGPRQLWQVPLGGGYSGIVAAEARIYTQWSHQKDELLGAFEPATGKRVWTLRLDEMRPDQFGDGPRATPLIDGERIYAVSALGKLHAVDRKTGKAAWMQDLRAKYGLVVPTWGVSSPPIVVGELVLHNVGGSAGHLFMAFDKTTGKPVWNSESGLAGYAQPITFEVGGIKQTLFFAGQKAVAVDPANGKKFWEVPWSTAYDVNAATPIFIAPDQVFLASGYDTGGALYKLEVAGGKVTPKELWRSRSMKNQFSTSIHLGGYLYGFDNKNFQCLDAKTGQSVWRRGGFGHGSLTYVDGHFIVLGDNGKLALVEASSQAYLEKASFQVAEGKHWTVPTYNQGTLYVRNEQNLIALALR
jgi:outer membrane protein assembly factor BamB